MYRPKEQKSKRSVTSLLKHFTLRRVFLSVGICALVFFASVIFIPKAHAASTYYAIANGNWNVNTTWSLSSGGAPVGAGVWPVAGDTVYIGDAGVARAVTVPTGYSAEALFVVIGNGANTVANSLSLADGTSSLTVSGNVDINKPSGSNINALNVNAGTVSIGGNVTLAGNTTTANRRAGVVITTGTLTISGNLVFEAGVDGNNLLTMSGGAGTLNLAGAFTATVGTLNAGATSAFNFNGTSAQTIPINVSDIDYNNLNINNTSASGATLSAAITSTNVAGNISVGNANSGSLFSTGNFAIGFGNLNTLTVASGSTMNAGTSVVAFNSSGGIVTINGTFITANTVGFSGSTTAAIRSTNNPTISLGSSSTIEYSSDSAQAVTARADYANLTFSGVGAKTTAAGTTTVSGNWDVSGGTATLNTNDSNFTVTGNISGTGPITSGSGTITIAGNWTNNGTFTKGTGIVIYNGTSTQTVGAVIYNNLTINKGGGTASLGGIGTRVDGTLTLSAGNITTGGNNIYISSTGNVLRTSGHIIGNLKKYIATGATSKTFEIGDATNYAPVSIDFTAVTVAGDLILSTTSGDHPNIGTSTIYDTKTVNRYWTATNSGITFDSYSAIFNFINPGDLDAGAVPADFIIGKWSGSSWSYPAVGTKTSASTQGTGLTSFSDYQLGEVGAAPNAPTLVSPSNGSSINDNTPTLSANYSDSGDVGTTNYRISSSSLSDCNNNINIITSGTSATTSSNNENTTWTPGSSIGSDATYYWCAQNDDGVLQSAWTSMGSFILDTTGPILTFTDDVQAGPVASDTITATWGDATVKKWDYDADGTCSTTSGDYSMTDANSMDQSTETNNSKYICLYGEDTLGNKSTLVSSNDINIDTNAPVIIITAPTKSSSTNITNTTIHITDDNGVQTANVTIDISTTISYSDFNCTQTDANTVDCTITITSLGNLAIKALDDLANFAIQSENNYIIDSIIPVITITALTKTLNSSITDTTIHVTDNIGILSSNVVVDASTTANTSQLVCIQTDAKSVDCTIHIDSNGNLTIRAVDTVGNIATQTESGYSINEVVIPMITSPASVGDIPSLNPVEISLDTPDQEVVQDLSELPEQELALFDIAAEPLGQGGKSIIPFIIGAIGISLTGLSILLYKNKRKQREINIRNAKYTIK